MLACASLPRPAAAQNARFTLAEELRIGSADPLREGLSAAPALAVAPNGTMYVVQPESHAVWAFDRAGRRLPDVGRRGSGPGEFEWPVDAGWRGDSLWVLDLSRVKFTLFDRALRPAGSVQVGPGLYPVGLLADASALAYERPADMEIGQGRVASSAYRRLSRGGRPLGAVASFSWGHYGMYIRNPAGGELPNTYRRQPFSDTPIFDVSSDGTAFVVVERPAAPGARGAFTVRRLDPSGRQRWASRVSYAARPLTERMIADSLAPQAADIARIPDFRATAATVEQWMRRQLYRPRNLPPVSAVVAGRDGTTWLRREAVQGGSVDWLVLDPRGQQIGTVGAPAALRVMEAERGTVWGVVKDDEGVPYLVRYRVRPASRRPGTR